MPDYAAQVPVADRWAIVAYIRALQLSQNAHAGRRARAHAASWLRRGSAAAPAAPRAPAAEASPVSTRRASPSRRRWTACSGTALLAGVAGLARRAWWAASSTRRSSSAPTCSASSSGPGSRSGCLSILMIHHLTGGIWGLAIRRLLEAGTRTLPLPGAAVPARCSSACRGSTCGRSPRRSRTIRSSSKQPYLNVPFFVGARRLLLRRSGRCSPTSSASGRCELDAAPREPAHLAAPAQPLRAAASCSWASPSRSRPSTGRCPSTRTGSPPSTACCSWSGQVLSAMALVIVVLGAARPTSEPLGRRGAARRSSTTSAS